MDAYRRGGKMPAYQRIAADLRAQITSGELGAGAQLPTEQELADRYDVARQTVRNGLGILVAEGLVVSQRPLGHFVRQREHMVYRPQGETSPQPASPEMDRFCQQILAEGRTPSQTIDVALVAATPDIAQRLAIDVGALVVVRRRIRFINGEPINTNDSHYPHELVKDSEIMSPADILVGANQKLAELGYPQDRVIDEIFFRMPTPEEAQRLDLGPGIPVAIHIATGYMKDGLPVRCTVNVLPGDRHMMVYERSWA